MSVLHLCKIIYLPIIFDNKRLKGLDIFVKMTDVDKVDMSLDDIIKLNRAEKRASQAVGRGRGRGRGTNIRGQMSRGLQGSSRGMGSKRGRGFGKRGAVVLKGRGPNRYQQVLTEGGGGINQGVNNQAVTRQQLTVRGTGRGTRKAIGQVNTGVQNQQRGQGQKWNLGQRLGRRRQGARVFTSLGRKKQQAIQNIIKVRQSQNRSLLVNQRRGLQTSTVSLNTIGSFKQGGRGRGRGRGRRIGQGRGLRRGSGLNRFDSTFSITSLGLQNRGRGARGQTVNRSFGGSTMSLNSVSLQGGKRKRWRTTAENDSLFTISVKNSPRPPRRNNLPRFNVGVDVATYTAADESDPTLQAQIRGLKPAVSTKYDFKKSVFAQAATSTSLNDRFSTALSSGDVSGTQNVTLEGRRVFF